MREATVERLARECGFDLVGVTTAVPSSDAGVYLDWVNRGLGGRMDYLSDHRATVRTDPRFLLSSARSVICLGKFYRTAGPGVPISRYAQEPDYHDVIREQLRALLVRLQAVYGEFDIKLCVDTAPLLERSYARLAGLGWIGRNTCLINQERGSWFFLAEILTSLDLEPDAPPPDRCGTCTRCIDACPTDALRPGGFRTELDATRCISYLTIELKGEIPEELREGLGTHAFGCDICQEVCPWNWTHTDADADAPSLDTLGELTAEEFRELFRRTPLWRSKYSGFLRNVAVAMGNSGDRSHETTLRKLASSSDATVASHANWALHRLEEAS